MLPAIRSAAFCTCFIFTAFLFIQFLHYVLLTVHHTHTASVVAAFNQSISCNRSQILTNIERSRNLCRAPHVAITISPLLGEKLQLYWEVEYIDDGDWLALLNVDPKCSSGEVEAIYKVPVRNTSGWVTTNVSDIFRTPQELGFHARCLEYWVAYFHLNGTVVASSCLQTNPTWMYDMKRQLENIKLKRIFIPGTHDSGAYTTYNSMPSFQDFIQKYVYTQDIDILSQLIYGVRYLDLRISSYKEKSGDERWWINHGIYKVHPLKDILNDVKTFLQNTNEIIILDFHEFPVGFEKDIEEHRELINFLRSELKEWIAYPDWSTTCGHLWVANKTLVISYNNEIAKEYPEILWLPVLQMWANVQKVNLLEHYLSEVIKRRPSYTWAAMAQLTPTAWSILTYQNRDLREMADEVNPPVAKWFQGIWGRTCNIVAVDFVRSTDIVRTAISWNLRRARKSSCDYE